MQKTKNANFIFSKKCNRDESIWKVNREEKFTFQIALTLLLQTPQVLMYQ